MKPATHSLSRAGEGLGADKPSPASMRPGSSGQ